MSKKRQKKKKYKKERGKEREERRGEKTRLNAETGERETKIQKG